nr:hypothetical protein [uncultured Campylobacter sp.]
MRRDFLRSQRDASRGAVFVAAGKISCRFYKTAAAALRFLPKRAGLRKL